MRRQRTSIDREGGPDTTRLGCFGASRLAGRRSTTRDGEKKEPRLLVACSCFAFMNTLEHFGTTMSAGISLNDTYLPATYFFVWHESLLKKYAVFARIRASVRKTNLLFRTPGLVVQRAFVPDSTVEHHSERGVLRA